MITVPNQKIVICDRWEGAIPNGETYTMVIHSIDKRAMFDLDGNAYVLYHYLCQNKRGFELALSPTAVKADTNMGKSAYDNAVKQLIEKGYLTNVRGNRYQFSIEPTQRRNAGNPVDGKSVDGKSVDGNPVDGKPDYGEPPSPGNHMTGSRVFEGPSPENHMTGSRVFGGETNINNNIDNKNSNIGVYPSKGNNIARGKTNTVDDETVRDMAFALMALTKKKYSPTVYRKILKEAGDMLSSKSKLSELDTLPIWQYMRFDSEDAFHEAVKKGKSQLPPDDQETSPAHTPDLQFEEDDELPF